MRESLLSLVENLRFGFEIVLYVWIICFVAVAWKYITESKIYKKQNILKKQDYHFIK